MKHNFEISGTIYSANETGTYFYKEVSGKKTRIKKSEYEQAWDEYMTTLNDQADADEWQAEADAEHKAREKAQLESDKAAEDAVNKGVQIPESALKANEKYIEGKKKASKPRKSKDIAFEMNSYGDDGSNTTLTLTAKQVDFVKHIPDTCFYEHGLESTMWCDVLADEIGGQFAGKPMTVGAMISTLREKNIVYVSEDRVNGKKCKFFGFTQLGKTVAKGLGLN